MSSSDESSLLETRLVTKVLRHENYNYTNLPDDIALLQLDRPVDLALHAPVCLPGAGERFTDTRGWVVGWGSVSFLCGILGCSYPDRLQEIEMDISSDEYCQGAIDLAASTGNTKPPQVTQ